MSDADRRRLVVRADAGSAIGTGHVMRQLALAQSWIDRGGSVEWIHAGAAVALVRRYEAEGATVHRLEAAYPDERDAGAVIAALEADGDARAVVDGPAFDTGYLDLLAPVARRVTVVDDMAQLPRYPVGTVLNQNAHAERARYPPADETRYLLGPRYALLRREFVAARPRPLLPVRGTRLLVAFGGADPTGMTIRAVRALATAGRRSAGIQVEVIVGPANPASEAIGREAAASRFPARLGHDVNDMTGPMARAHLALVSAGSTVWELARMGVPAVVVETAPAEADLVRGLASVGLFELLGREDRLDAGALVDAVEARLADHGWRSRMSGLGRRLVDGQGAERVATAIAGSPGNAR